VSLTPLNLAVSGFLLYYHQHSQSRIFYFFLIFASLFGFFVEVIGVHTGFIFGNYWYGKTLGIKVLEVPLLIGINWATLVIASASIATQIIGKSKEFIKIVIKAGIGAAIMTSLDFLIEPIAIYLDFWQWKNNTIPLQNYIAWFITAFILHFIYQKTNIEKHNYLAMVLLVSQILFFGFYNIFLGR
jgi:putative membrane protein